MKRSSLIAMCVLLCGCDLQEESSKKPWISYAWHKEQKKLEWWFTSYESHRDCIEHMKAEVSSGPNTQWYAEPIGCAYTSNSYWAVWWNNLIHPDKNIQCIWRSFGSTNMKAGYRLTRAEAEQAAIAAQYKCSSTGFPQA